MNMNILVSRLLLRPYPRCHPNYVRQFRAGHGNKLCAVGGPQLNAHCGGSQHSDNAGDKILSITKMAPSGARVRCMGTSSVFWSKDDKDDDSLAIRMLNKIFPSNSQYKLRPKGFFLLTQCVQKVDVKEFFKVFDMPDTFFSWFLVTELHVWMLSVRLMEEGPLGRSLRNFVVEALWMDCDARAKLVGDMSSSARTSMVNDMAEEFQVALFVYDEGLLGGDMDLAASLWRRFFLSQPLEEDEQQPLPDPEKIELLVKYVRKTIKYLEDYDGDRMFHKCEVDWLPLDSQ